MSLWSELEQDLAENADGPRWSWRTLFVLLSVPVVMTVQRYWGNSGFFTRHLRTRVLKWFGLGHGFRFYSLLPLLYRAASSVVLRVAVPCAIIKLVLRGRIADHGFRLPGKNAHGTVYLVFFALMLPLIIAMSFTAPFQNKYPLFSDAGLSITHLALFELSMGVRFAVVEAFFRGYGVFALRPTFGFYAVPIMAVPYGVGHFGKPAAETLGSVVAGLTLGYLSLKSRSWVYGFLLHWGVGLSMDVLALWHKGKLGL